MTDETTICIYCDREVPAPASEPVPDVRDDEAWEALAAEHEPDCEWITTRAHRVFPAEGS